MIAMLKKYKALKDPEAKLGREILKYELSKGHRSGVPIMFHKPKQKLPVVQTLKEIYEIHKGNSDEAVKEAILHLRDLGLSQANAAKCLGIKTAALSMQVFRRDIEWTRKPRPWK